MKSLILALSLILAAPSYAVSLMCENFTSEGYDEASHGIVITDIVELKCDSSQGDSFDVLIEGFGGALRFDRDAVTINCPIVKNPAGTYVGTKVSATGFFGVSVGVYVGPGVCFLGGLTMGLGASATLGTMTITE
jgi:hypothetical protein